MMKFKKMHGLGNDFVILDARQEDIFLSDEQIKKIADRHFGVGCDLVTILEPSEKADVFARFLNADGSESGACGNATRCVADIIMNETGFSDCKIEVTYGVLECRKAGDLVQVNMGKAKNVQDLDLTEGGLSNPVSVDMGNPHCVFFVDDLSAIEIDLADVGSAVENHDLFPNRTNVEFVQVLEDGRLRQITWERGCGFTLACGSGACAVLAAAIHRGFVETKAEVILDGGSLLMEKNEAGYILMTGPVAYVFDGEIKL
ncbi:MAG: diaminopimelate epimerase [Alphaproteobacteria bacterium]|nr:diaminopimelate epimerase [Alphaproteobacteria bacterium]